MRIIQPPAGKSGLLQRMMVLLAQDERDPLDRHWTFEFFRDPLRRQDHPHILPRMEEGKLEDRDPAGDLHMIILLKIVKQMQLKLDGRAADKGL